MWPSDTPKRQGVGNWAVSAWRQGTMQGAQHRPSLRVTSCQDTEEAENGGQSQTQDRPRNISDLWLPGVMVSTGWRYGGTRAKCKCSFLVLLILSLELKRTFVKTHSSLWILVEFYHYHRHSHESAAICLTPSLFRVTPLSCSIPAHGSGGFSEHRPSDGGHSRHWMMLVRPPETLVIMLQHDEPHRCYVDRSSTQKATRCLIPFTWDVQNKKICRQKAHEELSGAGSGGGNKGMGSDI